MKKFWVPLWVPFGTQNMTKISKFEEILIFTTPKNANMVPKMVPQWYPNGTQVVPKLPDTFYCMINFHQFQGPKNGSEATLAIILGTIASSWVPSMIFSENISSQLFKKKLSSLSRIIYLPSLKLLFFCQIPNFHLWANL